MATLVRWDPYRQMMSMRRQMDRMFDDTFRSLESQGSDGESSGNLEIDVSESEEQYTILASLPGIDPDDVDVSIHDNMLTISGESQHESESESDHYHVRERRFGRFSRSIGLPSNVDLDNIDADSKNGVLSIKLPKLEETKPRRINVKGNGASQTIEAKSSKNGTDKKKSKEKA